MNIRLSRIELWSDLEGAGGERLAFEPECYAAHQLESTDEGGLLRLSIPLDGYAWSVARHRRVVRVVLTDETWKEWRILRSRSGRDNSNVLIGMLECENPITDLTDQIISRTEANGGVVHDFGLYGLVPEAVAEYILTFGPGHFALGDIEPTTSVDISFAWDSPLSALRQLAVVSNSSLEIERGEDNLYHISLRANDGLVDTGARIRYRKNLLSIDRQQDIEPLITRAYPQGASIDGFHSDMGQAAWLVTNSSGNNYDFSESPIAFDDQLNGLYLAPMGGGSGVLITDTILATQRVVLAGPLPVGTIRAHVRRTAEGGVLTYLDNPEAQANYLGVGEHKAKVIEVSDIPAIDNLVETPYLDQWYTGLPIGWGVRADATTSIETSELYRQHGVSSAHVVSTAAEAGIQTDWIPIVPTESKPYYSAQVNLWVVSGKVNIEMVAENAESEEFIFPTGVFAYTSVLGGWVTLGITGINLFELEAVRVRLRVLGYVGPAEFYVDAAQLTQTAGGESTIYSGRGSNDLWKEANKALLEHVEPEESFDVNVADLYRLDPTAYELDEIRLGTMVTVVDEDLGISIQTRIIEIQRDLLVPGAVSIQLANRVPGLTGQLSGVSRRPRQPEVGGGTETTVVEASGSVELHASPLGILTGSFSGNELARSFGYRISTDPPPIEALDDAEDLTIIDERSGLLDPELIIGEDETAYLTGFFFPQPGGGGTPGRRILATATIPGAVVDIDPEFPLSSGEYLATLTDARRAAAESVALALSYKFSADVRTGDAGTEISKIMTQPLYDPSGTILLLDTYAQQLRAIAFHTDVEDSEGREVRRMFAKSDPTRPDDARGVDFLSGVTIESLKPGEAGANITETRTASDVLYGVGKAVAEAGATLGAKAGTNLKDASNNVLTNADVITNLGTSSDTSNVSGTAAATVRTGATSANLALNTSGQLLPNTVADENAFTTGVFDDESVMTRVFANNVFTEVAMIHLAAIGTVTYKLAAGETLIAGEVFTDKLSSLSAVMGELAIGIMFNALRAASPTSAIRLSSDYTIESSVRRYLDLAASADYWMMVKDSAGVEKVSISDEGDAYMRSITVAGQELLGEAVIIEDWEGNTVGSILSDTDAVHFWGQFSGTSPYQSMSMWLHPVDLKYILSLYSQDRINVQADEEINLNAGVVIRIQSQDISFGANDSESSGYRNVRVPNI